MKYGSVCSAIEAASVAWHPLRWENELILSNPFYQNKNNFTTKHCGIKISCIFGVSKRNDMTIIEITYKPNSRIGNGMIAAPSKMKADISPKENTWKQYGDQEIANMWAAQILSQRFSEPCTLLEAKVIIK